MRWLCRGAPRPFDTASVTVIRAPGEATVQILLEGEPIPAFWGKGCDTAFGERAASAHSLLSHGATIFYPQRNGEAHVSAMRRAWRYPQAPAVGLDD